MILTKKELNALMNYSEMNKVISLTFGPGYVRLNKTNKNKWAYIQVLKKRRKEANAKIAKKIDSKKRDI